MRAVSAPLWIYAGTSASIGGNALLLGAVTTTTINIPGVRKGMSVIVTPTTYPGDGIDWSAYVSSNDTITVVVRALIAATPTLSTYNVRVIT